MARHVRAARVCVAAIAVLVAPSFAAGAPPEDDAAYRAGIGLLNKGVPDLAVVELEKYLKEHGTEEHAANARYALAVCLVRLGRHAEAAKELDAVLGIKGFEFGADAAMLRAQCASAAGDDVGAAKVLGALLDEHPDCAKADRASALRGEALYRTGDFKAAKAVLASVAEKWPGSPEVERSELFCAMAESAAGDARSAAERAARLRAKAPRGEYSAHAALIEARCRQSLGELEASAGLYDAAMKGSDASVKAEATLGRAQVARGAGDTGLAERLLKELESQAPSDAVRAGARLERVRVLLDQGRAPDAQRALAEMKDVPESLADDVAYWGARCAMAAGKPDAAAAHLKAAAERFPSSELVPEMLFDRAVALSRAGNDGEAGAAWKAWLERFPKHALAPEALSARAGCLHRTGEYAQSLAVCGEFMKTWVKHARSAGVALLIAENLYLSERFEEAEVAYGGFIERYGKDPGAWRASVRRGLCMSRLGRAEDATRLLSAAMTAPGNAHAEDAPLRRAAIAALADSAFAASDWPAAERWYAALAGEPDGQPGPALLRQGLSMARQGKGSAAATIFERAERAGPGTDVERRARFERGQVLVEAGKLDDAKALFEAVIGDAADAKDSITPHALRHLAAIASKQGRPDDAAALLSKMPAGAGGDVLLQQASAWLSAGKYAEAERAYTKAIEAGETSAEARAHRAIAINRQGRAEEALKEIDAIGEGVSTLDADTGAAVTYERALALRALGRDEDAAEAYRGVLAARAPASIAAFSALDLAQIETRGERHEEAVKLLDRCAEAARELNAPEAARLGERESYLRGVCLLKLGRAGEAASVLGSFTERYPASELMPHAGLTLGEALLQSGRAAEAVERFKKVSENGASSDVTSVALLKLGDACVAVERWSAADEAYSAFLDRFKESEQWYQARFGQGWCRERQGRFDKAVEAYRDVASRHSGATAARAQFQIGECLYAQKRHAEAVAELLKVDVLFASPEWSAAALYEAGRCLAEMGRHAEAVRQFAEVVERFPDSKWAAPAKERAATVKPEALPGRASAVVGVK